MSKAIAYINVLESILPLLKEEVKPKVVDSLFGFPLEYCPDELIIQFLEEEDNCPEMAHISDVLKARYELNRREQLGIEIREKGKKKK